jgi:CheY-like chemotaxis protein
LGYIRRDIGSGVFVDPESAPQPSEARISARVAVVDDDPISITLQERLVSLLGHSALVEPDAQKAVDRALEGEFDLILLDLNMPGLNGFEALRQLREREAVLGRSPIPVIAVTGYTSESDRLRCLMAGFAEQLSKPVHADAFELAIRRALQHRAESAFGPPGDAQSDADRLRATVRRLSDIKPAQKSFGPTVMESFALRSQQLIEAIRQALFEHETEQVVRSSRALKSAADFLGVNRLAAMCVHLEELMLAQRWNTAEQTLQDIEQEHQVVLAVLFESTR